MALGVADDGDSVGDHMLAALNADHLAGDSGRNHYLVQDCAGLLNGAQHVAGYELIAHIGYGNKVPLFLSVQCGHVSSLQAPRPHYGEPRHV